MIKKILWMYCTQCKGTVVRNDSGICLACQGAYDTSNQPDSWASIHKCKKCGGGIAAVAGECRSCIPKKG